MKELKYKAFDFVKRNGPILPVKLTKVLNTSILFSSAVLSELVSERKVMLTHANIGGSPLYYIKGQESKLDILYDHLPGKEKEAFDLLKEQKVLKDRALEPAIRVALRQLKDFSVRLDVKSEDQVEIFWKWYMLSNDEAEKLIRNLLDGKVEEEIGEVKEEIIEVPEIKEEIIEIPEVKEEIVEEPEIKEEVVKEEEVKEKIKKPKKIKKEQKVKKVEKVKKEKQSMLEIKEKKIERKIEKKELPKDEFFGRVENYFKEIGVDIISQMSIKKNKEIDMVVKVPSSLGSLLYYVKARNKKTVSLADLTMAYQIGQGQRLPTLYLSNAMLNKKTQEYLEKNMKGYLMYKKL